MHQSPPLNLGFGPAAHGSHLSWNSCYVIPSNSTGQLNWRWTAGWDEFKCTDVITYFIPAQAPRKEGPSRRSRAVPLEFRDQGRWGLTDCGCVGCVGIPSSGKNVRDII
jgi:hypothetical protein